MADYWKFRRNGNYLDAGAVGVDANPFDNVDADLHFVINGTHLAPDVALNDEQIKVWDSPHGHIRNANQVETDKEQQCMDEDHVLREKKSARESLTVGHVERARNQWLMDQINVLRTAVRLPTLTKTQMNQAIQDLM